MESRESTSNTQNLQLRISQLQGNFMNSWSWQEPRGGPSKPTYSPSFFWNKILNILKNLMYMYIKIRQKKQVLELQNHNHSSGCWVSTIAITRDHNLPPIALICSWVIELRQAWSSSRTGNVRENLSPNWLFWQWRFCGGGGEPRRQMNGFCISV